MATIVLAHGAWSAAWAWKKMRPLFAAAGHQFFSPTYTGLGERAHLAHHEIDLRARPLTTVLTGLVIGLVLQIVVWIIFAQIILSWLVAFNVINTSSHFVRSALNFLDRVTAPLYRPVRKILPDFGGIDFSPMVILLVIFLLRNKVLPGILLEVGPTIT